eukprot:scaffold731_cov261-Pinguiococcus_pyrenoidosus.AAC.105
MILFSIAAAGVVGDSEALDDRDECTDLETYLGFGVGISCFLVFWILAQIGIIVFPCGPLGESVSAPTQTQQDKSSHDDKKIETEVAS